MGPSVGTMYSALSQPQGANTLDSGCFEECYSLAQIGDQSTTVNQLAPQAQFRPRAFEKCSTLQQLNFERTEYDPTNLNRSIPEGCFFEAGIESLLCNIRGIWVLIHANWVADLLLPPTLPPHV